MVVAERLKRKQSWILKIFCLKKDFNLWTEGKNDWSYIVLEVREQILFNTWIS
jgi:hypothetical protein